MIGQGRKTGALAISSGNQESVLYFRKGALVDVRAGLDHGLEALSQIIGWNNGTFEFRSGAVTDDMTIDMDSHNALTEAARMHNEMKRRALDEALHKQEEEQRLAAEALLAQEAEALLAQEAEVKAEVRPEQTAQSGGAAEEKTPQPLDAETCEQFDQWIAKSPFLRHVSLLDAEGRVIGEAHAHGASPNGNYKLSQHMREFVREYPRAEMRRVVIEDEAGTVVLANLPRERLLIAVADGSVSLGNVFVTLSKMTASLGA
jgi:ATP-dependent Clp protease ATP-binding subunit ClpA